MPSQIVLKIIAARDAVEAQLLEAGKEDDAELLAIRSNLTAALHAAWIAELNS